MTQYKGVPYWYNEMQHHWIAQVGYSIIAKSLTETGIKIKITNYLKSLDDELEQ